MSAVYKKELRAIFCGMTGAIFAAYVLVFLGLYCADSTFGQSSARLDTAIITASFLSLLAVPVLTMRSFSEERHTKTDQLLYSLPISTGSIVCGKFFAMITVFALPCAVLCLFPPITAMFCTAGSINFAAIYGTIAAYFLLGCAVIGICMFLSTLTESQVIAAIISLGTLLLLFFMAAFAGMIPSESVFGLAFMLVLALIVAYIIWLTVKNYAALIISAVVLVGGIVTTYIINAELFDGLAGKILSAAAVFSPIESFAYGVFDITVLLYYLSVTALFVFFTVQSFEKRRWS